MHTPRSFAALALRLYGFDLRANGKEMSSPSQELDQKDNCFADMLNMICWQGLPFLNRLHLRTGSGNLQLDRIYILDRFFLAAASKRSDLNRSDS